MNCASCGQTNPIGSRFCSGCGASLAPRCPACDTECAVGARFCNGCGAAMLATSEVHRAVPIADAVSRKIVTIVFADLIGSVSLHERLDAESARRLMDRYHRAMSAAVDVHGGRVVQLLGDGVLAAFGVPRVAEDDAIRAVRAAVGMQRTFRELAREQGAAMEGVGLRVAVNTGEIIVSDDENSVMGDPTNVAARLQQEARDGDVIVGEGTQRLVADLVTLAPLGAFALRGRAESVAAYRVVSLDRPAASRQATAFVGRDEELRRLITVYDAAVATPSARLVVLLGSPGLGKSRLVAEFTRRAGERATVLSARCDADGGATFAPLAAALRALLHIEEGAGGDVLRAAVDAVVSGDDAERTRIAAGIGALLAGEPALPEETFFVVRRLLAALATVRPVVLVIDDLHWAEPLLLDLVEHLVQWSSGVPLLVLVAARPELRDARSSLATPSGVVTDVVTLSGLDASAATRLAANVIGGSELPAALAGRVLATSEGNPLFVSELVRMLVQDGTLVREGDRWITTVEIAKLDMPATIQVLLAARIERLRPEERSVLERAAVIGRHFSRAAVAQLLPSGTIDLDARLEALRRSELIEPDTGWFLGEPALRFHHVLIRDAAYRRVLKETRAELHERLANWIVARIGESVEHDETIGWHFEQAHQNLRELGAQDAHGASLGERAAHHLGAAGRRALAREDLALAAGLLGRALDRLDPVDPARAELALDWCEALLAGGDVAPAARAIDELATHMADSDRLRAWHTCFVGQLAVLTDPQSLRATADTIARAAEALASLGDAAGEAKAHSVHATALSRLGEVGACETALDKALAAARRARDRRRANAVLAGAPVAALWGPSPVTRASGRCLDVVRVLRITQGAPAVEAVALRCQAVLETLRGRGEAARRMIASSRRMVEELGIAQQLFEADVFAGHIELLEGDAEAAEQFLRSAYDGLRERGLGIDAARAAALLGRALLAQQRAAEAEALSHESEALAGDDLKAAIAWRGVRAEALARRGESAIAVELARAAVAIAAATDALLDHADARQALAAALRAAGRDVEANAEETRAIELWEAKGATLLVERARGTTGRDSASAPPAAGADESMHTPRRRVHPNFATEQTRRLGAAIAARDASALPTLWSEDAVVFHHPTGLTYGGAAAVDLFRAAFAESADLSAEVVSLATLGASLALSRMQASATEVASAGQSYGAVELRRLILMEANARSQAVRVELFADDRLTDAIVRLYERYAELLPEGAERDSAAMTANAVASILTASDPIAQAEGFATEHEFVDHRVLGFPPSRGREAVRASQRALYELATDCAVHVEELLGVRPEALLLRSIASGTDRSSGGRFEREVVQLQIFGADGRIRRSEWFDPDDATHALARFDELTSGRPVVARRPVRPNFASELTRRLNVAVAARDVSALPDLWTEDAVIFHHPTGLTYGRDAAVGRFRAGFQSTTGLAIEHASIATLGASLGLACMHASAASLVSDGQSFGAIEFHPVTLTEANERSQAVNVELFADDHLADAITRLYERHAELTPDGPERVRAAATARSVSAWLQSFSDADRFATALAPAAQFVDHRLVGLPSARGAEAMMRGHRAQLELARDVVFRVDDIAALTPDAFLLRATTCGVDRASGGAYERPLRVLGVFGADGLVTHIEWFEPDHDAAALTRFDDLTAPQTQKRRVRPNAATANGARLDAAVNAGDMEAISRVFAVDLETQHHATGICYDRDAALTRFRGTLAGVRDFVFGHESIATLGDSLALCRSLISFSALIADDIDVGAVERDQIALIEVDARGQRSRSEIFSDGKLGDAVVRLYERHAELLTADSTKSSAAKTAHAVAALFAAPAIERIAETMASDIEYTDHMKLGMGSARGRDALLRGIRNQIETADDIAPHVEEVLALEAEALAVRWTIQGSLRAGGGRYEKHLISLWVWQSDGLLKRWEQFDADRAFEALARFDELTAVAPKTRFANAATRAKDRMSEAWRARDFDRYAALFPPHHRTIDNRRLMHVELGRDELLAGFRPIFETGARFDVEITLLATRGERLALFRERVTGEVAEVGPSEVEYLQIIGVDERGDLTLGIIFDPEDLDGANMEVWRRYLAGEGKPYAALFGWMREFSRISFIRDWDALDRLLPDDFTHISHRRFAGTGSRMDRAEYLRTRGSLEDLSLRGDTRIDHLLRIGPRAAAFAMTWFGTLDGGEFENRFITVIAHDGRRMHANEIFDEDQQGAALARYEELSHGSAAPAHIENAATRTAERLRLACEALDIEAIAAQLSPLYRSIDRQKTAQLESDRAAYLEAGRAMFAGFSSSSPTHRTLATRGERLTLGHVHWESTGDEVGTVEFEWLSVIEVDGDGLVATQIDFDPEDLDAAYAELDARYAAGEAVTERRAAITRAFSTAFAARDWDALAALLAPDLVAQDHRLLGWETLHGPAAYVQALHSLIELAPDTQLRLDHVSIAAPRFLYVATWIGTRDGGEFEMPSVIVSELDVDGRIRRFDQYDIDRLDEIRAGFAELRPRKRSAQRAVGERSSSGSLRIPPNSATRVGDRFRDHALAADWEALRDLCAPIAFEDRRPLFRTSGGCEMIVANTQAIDRSIWERSTRTLLATVGDRIALHHNHWRGDEAAGAFEVDTLEVTEVDADGRIVAAIVFDPSDRRDAGSELLERYARIETGRLVPRMSWELARAMRAHDLDRVRALMPADFAFNDHRRIGAGRLDKEEYLAWLGGLFEHSSDAVIEPLYNVEEAPHGVLSVSHTFGTRIDGGDFESVFVSLRGPAGVELYDLEDLERARARFEALRPDPLRIPPNAATRVGDRFRDHALAADWEALRDLCAPIAFEDRRPLFRTSGGCEMIVANTQAIDRSIWERSTHTLLATAGDRLALHHNHWRGDEAAGAFEVDTLEVTEVDADGRIVAAIVFDPGDRRAASLEMGERYHRGEGARFAHAVSREFGRAMRDRDLDAIRASLPADFVFDDHRRTGAGRIESADDYVASFAALLELAPDVGTDVLYIVAVEEHASLSVSRSFGTLADGGGAFESIYVRLICFENGRQTGTELFEIGDLDRARALFEARRPDPLRIPPNAATRTSDRLLELRGARDWDAVRALCSPEMILDDRRRGSLLRGDRDMFLASMRAVEDAAAPRVSSTLLATAGDRLALRHLHFAGTADGGGAVEAETLSLLEVDAEGRIAAIVAFDPGDRRGATVELVERYEASDAGQPRRGSRLGLMRAIRDRDLDRVRSALPEGFVYHDHRRIGAGQLDGEEFIAWMAGLFEQSSDALIAPLYTIAVGDPALLEMARMSGTLVASGGDFENVYLRLLVFRGEECIRIELFEPTDLAVARARFEEVCAERA